MAPGDLTGLEGLEAGPRGKTPQRMRPISTALASGELEAHAFSGDELVAETTGTSSSSGGGAERGTQSGHWAGQLQGAEAVAEAAASAAAAAAAVPSGPEERDRQRVTRAKTIRHILSQLHERADDATITASAQQLAARCGVTALNMVLLHSGEMGHTKVAERMLGIMEGAGLCNEHTHATAFRVMHKGGKLDTCLSIFDRACRAGRDLGPIACSALLHTCLRNNNTRMAWELFDAMVACKMTLNRYAYNCMAYMASQKGSLSDTILVYNMMKSQPDPASHPDSYTYSALVRAAGLAGRWDMLPALFNEMVAAHYAGERARGRPRVMVPGEGSMSHEVWGHFISAAVRAGRSDLALNFYDSGMRDLGLLPTQHIYNMLLQALARSRTTPYDHVARVYREMVDGVVRHATDPADRNRRMAVEQAGMRPDEYTFNALLLAAGRTQQSAAVADALLEDMGRWGVAINAFVGTSLINAYRKCPEMAAGGPAAAALVAKAEAVVQALRAGQQLTGNTFANMAALYAQAGRGNEVVALLREAERAGHMPEAVAYRPIIQACFDGELHELAQVLERRLERYEAARQQHIRAAAGAGRPPPPSPGYMAGGGIRG